MIECQNLNLSIENLEVYCWIAFFLDNAFSRGRKPGVERPDRPRTFSRRWHIQQRVIKYEK